MRIYEFIKPISVYYHGSNIDGIKQLKPTYSSIVDNRVVFAAILPEVAVAMTGHWTDNDFYFGHSVSTKNEIDFIPYSFKELKKGAMEHFFNNKIYIYTVPSKMFEEHKNLQDFELISYNSVNVHSSIEAENALDYLESSPYIDLIYY